MSARPGSESPMQKWLFGAVLGSAVMLSACATSSPSTTGAAVGAPSAAVAAPAPAVLEGVAVDAAIPGLAGAVWSDPKNSGYVTGYTYKGQYHPGPPPGYDPTTHSVVNK